MAIGLLMGRDFPSDERDQCYEAVRDFMGRFATKFGELNCQKLAGVHLGTPEGQALFIAKGQNKLCTEYVAEAAQFVLDIVEGKTNADAKDEAE